MCSCGLGGVLLLVVFVMLFVFVLYVFCFLDFFVVRRILVGIEYMLIPLLIKLCSHTHARTHTRARARVLPHTHVHTERETHTHTFSRIQTHTNTKHTVTTHSMKNNINNGEPFFFKIQLQKKNLWKNCPTCIRV